MGIDFGILVIEGESKMVDVSFLNLSSEFEKFVFEFFDLLVVEL